MDNIIYGQIPSKSNCYKIITINGHASLAKQKALKEYEKSFLLQCKLRDKNIRGAFKVSVDVFYPSDRQDLDNAFKIFLDCLQMCKVIDNDRHCIDIHGRKFIDKVNPRIEFDIEEV